MKFYLRIAAITLAVALAVQASVQTYDLIIGLAIAVTLGYTTGIAIFEDEGNATVHVTFHSVPSSVPAISVPAINIVGQRPVEIKHDSQAQDSPDDEDDDEDSDDSYWPYR